MRFKVKSLTCIWLFVTPQTVAHQAPLSMGFSRREYWSGLPFPSPKDLPDQGSNPGLLHCRQMLYHLSQQWDLVTLKKLKTVSVIDQRLLLVKLQTILRSLALSENLIGFFFFLFFTWYSNLRSNVDTFIKHKES